MTFHFGHRIIFSVSIGYKKTCLVLFTAPRCKKQLPIKVISNRKKYLPAGWRAGQKQNLLDGRQTFSMAQNCQTQNELSGDKLPDHTAGTSKAGGQHHLPRALQGKIKVPFGESREKVSEVPSRWKIP